MSAEALSIHRQDVETLRVVRAFYKITDTETRRIILQVIEEAAQGATLHTATTE